MNTQTDVIREALEYGLGLASSEQARTGRSHSILLQHFKDALAALSELEAQPAMMTREQIANRIREEHKKHPTLDWADIAAAKILASMRDEAQPSQTEDLEARAREWRDNNWHRFDVANPAPMLAAFARSIAQPSAPTVERVDTRDPECVKRWPECQSGEYHPNCCRFPKSCSC